MPGSLGACLAFRLERQVDILQFRAVPCCLDAFLQFRGQLFLFADGVQDGLLALGRLLQFFVLGADGFNLHFVQSSRAFLAVSADERDGSSLLQQFDGMGGLALCDAERLGYQLAEYLFHYYSCFDVSEEAKVRKTTVSCKSSDGYPGVFRDTSEMPQSRLSSLPAPYQLPVYRLGRGREKVGRRGDFGETFILCWEINIFVEYTLLY